MAHRFPSPPTKYNVERFRRILQDVTGAFQASEASINGLKKQFNPTIDTLGGAVAVTDSGRIFSNEGASAVVTFNLPPVVEDLSYGFCCLNANGIRVQINGSDSMYIGSQALSTGGNVQSTTLGSMIYFVGFNAAWVSLVETGTWTIGFHFDTVQANLTLQGKKLNLLVA